MEKHNKILIDKLQSQLGSDIDNNLVKELADHIKECEDCMTNVDSIQQTIDMIKLGDYDMLLPREVSKRLFKALDLEKK